MAKDDLIQVVYRECSTVPTDHAASPESELEHTTHNVLVDPELTRRRKRPLMLHPIVGWGLVALSIMLAVVLAVLYWHSFKNNGVFTIYPARGLRDEALQFLWSSGPTFGTILITGLLSSLAFELYLIAPYAELERGGATAQASILANYVVLSEYGRFRLALKNGKWGLVTLSSARFLAILLGTAASGLIESRNVVITTNLPVRVTAPLGIASSPDGIVGADGRSHIFLSSNQCLAAILFAGGQQLYEASPVPYSYYGQEGNWSITPLDLPSYDLPALGHGFNSSIVANLTVDAFGINSIANCKPASIAFRDNATITATVDQCSADFSVSTNQTFTRWHNATSIPCSDASRTDAGFKTFVYAVYRPSGYAARDPSQFLFMFCQPTISIAKVSATMSVTHDGRIGALVAPPRVLELYPIGSTSSNPGVNSLLGPPLNGNALNGYDIPEPAGKENYSRSNRAIIVQNLLYEGIYGAQDYHMPFNDRIGTDSDWFSASQRVRLSNIIADFYQAYVSTFSRSVYYDLNTTTTTTINGQMSTPQTRAVISRLNVIALDVLLLLLALLLTITLIKQPTPDLYGDAVQLSRGTIMDHLMATSRHVLDFVGQLSPMTDVQRKAKLRDRRFSFQEGGKIVHE